MSEKIRIIEVGPRDGLQNEAKPIPLEIKKEFIRRLLGAGVRKFKAGALVRPGKIPQMADSEKILDAPARLLSIFGLPPPAPKLFKLYWPRVAAAPVGQAFRFPRRAVDFPCPFATRALSS